MAAKVSKKPQNKKFAKVYKKPQTNKFKIILPVLAALLVAVSGGVYILQSSAASASTCGTGYKHYNTVDLSGPMEAKMYRKTSTSPDKKCVILQATGSAYGTSHWMSLIYGGAEDDGNYRYYAGPLYDTGSIGSDCIYAYTEWRGTYYKSSGKYCF